MSPTIASIRIFESELDQIADAVAGSPNLETGGELLGLWSHADMPTVMLAGVTVMLAGTPAPGSRRGTTWFEQDPQTHMALERLSWERYGVQVVGLWHSHHQLSLRELSHGDIRRTQGYSTRHGRPRYSEILGFLVEDEHSQPQHSGQPRLQVGLRPYVYADAATGRALPTRLEKLPGTSPLRLALRHERLGDALEQVLDGTGRRRRGRIEVFMTQHHPAPDVPPVEAAPQPVPPGEVDTPAAGSAPPDTDAQARDAATSVSGEDVADPPSGDAASAQTESGAAPDSASVDDEAPWPIPSLESALACLPTAVAARAHVTPAQGCWEVEIADEQGRRRLVLEIAGDTQASGHVTAFIATGRHPEEWLFERRDARDVELVSALVDGVARLGYQTGRS